MARLSREESQALTREKIMKAAHKQVVEHGFAAASVRDIAEAAGFSQGAFYSNFESKEALLLDLMRAHKEREIADVRGFLASATSTDAMFGALETWLATLAAKADWAVLAVELELQAARSPSFAKQYRALAKEQLAAIAQVIAGIFRGLGLVEPLAVDQLASGFVALSHGLAVQQPALSAVAYKEIYLTFLQGVIALARKSP